MFLVKVFSCVFSFSVCALSLLLFSPQTILMCYCSKTYFHISSKQAQEPTCEFKHQMIQKLMSCKGFVLTSNSFQALNPLQELKLGLLIGKINQLFTILLCSRPTCHLGLEKDEMEKAKGLSQILELAVSCCTQMMWTKGVKDVLGCLPIFDKCVVGKSSVTWRSSHFHQWQSPDHVFQEIRPAEQAASRERRLILGMGAASPHGQPSLRQSRSPFTLLGTVRGAETKGQGLVNSEASKGLSSPRWPWQARGQGWAERSPSAAAQRAACGGQGQELLCAARQSCGSDGY